MKNKAKTKTFISTLLLTAITFTCSPLWATNLSSNLQVTPSPEVTAPPTNHKQFITQSINEIRNIQNRTFQLIQAALDNPIRDMVSFKINMDTINNDAAKLRQNILAYQTTLLDTSSEYRDVLLLLNALNYTKNALFELESLPQTSSNVERTRILENLFQSRAQGINALNILENINA